MIHRNVTTVRDFARVWFQWKTHAKWVFGLIVALGILYAYGWTSTYESRAKVVVLPRTGEGLVTAGNDALRMLQVTAEDINTELEIMTSQELLATTIQSFMDEGKKVSLVKKDKNPFDRLKTLIKKGLHQVLVFVGLLDTLTPMQSLIEQYSGALEVTPVPLSNSISISLQAEEPKTAQMALERFLEIYIKFHQRIFYQANSVNYYNSQAKAFQNELDSTEESLFKSQKGVGVVDVNLLNQKNTELQSNLEQQENQIVTKIGESRNRIKILEEMLRDNKEEIPLTSDLASFPVIAQLNNAFVPLILKRNEVLKTFTKDSREYQEISQEMTLLNEQKRNEIRKILANEQMEIKSLQGRQSALQAEIKDLQNKTIDLNMKWQSISELRENANVQMNNYKLYHSKSKEAQAQLDRLDLNITNVSIADHATYPIGRASPKRLLVVILALFLGAISALCVPFVFEFFDQRLKTSGDVQVVLGMPVIGALPEILPSQTEKPDRFAAIKNLFFKKISGRHV